MNGTPDTLAITTRQLTRHFGTHPAVNGLDLDVRRGEMFGLVGPDGAGKSTVIRLLCGLLKPSGGTGNVLDFDLLTEAEQIKRHSGYLSQAFTLYGDLTVDENVAFFAAIHDVTDFRKRRDELLEFTRLTAFRKRLADNLSGGMKKKLALACTLIHTPQLILLDEPSTGVDPVSRGEFWNILSGILEQGTTIVMTTPYLDEAERCHRVGLMHAGRLIMTDTPERIKAAIPGQMLEVRLAAPRKAYEWLREKGWGPRMALLGDRLRVWQPDAAAGAAQVAALLQIGGFAAPVITPVPPTLEDAFIALLKRDETHETKNT